MTLEFMDQGKQQFYVMLRAGYRKDSPRLVIECWLDIGEGRAEWGAEPGQEYFRLHITWVNRRNWKATRAAEGPGSAAGSGDAGGHWPVFGRCDGPPRETPGHPLGREDGERRKGWSSA